MSNHPLLAGPAVDDEFPDVQTANPQHLDVEHACSASPQPKGADCQASNREGTDCRGAECARSNGHRAERHGSD